ncbi:MAG: FHA domain-containing protein [Candidatus Latescibacteria bacterium]|jgi:hypothetical protein|nr:FHA domain-containing protein [Candidatus Latescibacterota bacterium]
MKVCPDCNTENEDVVEYCKDCGVDLTAVEVKHEADAEVEETPASTSDAAEVSDDQSGDAIELEVGEDLDADVSTDENASDVADELVEVADDGEQLEGPYLVVVTTGDKIPLTKPEMVIGREDPISNIFPDIDTTPFGGLEGGVSRKHAKLIESAGQYSIEDLNSTNYTLVNKEKQEPSAARPLVAGDEIRLGRVAMLFML